MIYIEKSGLVESVVGRDMDWLIADRLAGQMQERARPGMRFKAVNDREHKIKEGKVYTA